MRKIYFLLLLTLSTIPLSAEKISGAEDGITWALDTETGVLQLSSKSGSNNYHGSSYPWLSYRNYITSVEINFKMYGYTPTFSIGECMFYGCKNLTKVNIPHAVCTIERNAFGNCSKLQTIIFGDANNAKYVNGPSKLTPATRFFLSIEDEAFYNCSSLESIDLPNYVEQIGDYAFFGCKKLSSVTLDHTAYWDENTNIAMGQSVFEGCSSLNNIEILENTTSLGSRIFANCTSLTQISIPSNIREIAEDAFVGCNNLSTVRWNTTAQSNAFVNNESIQEVIFEDSVFIIDPIFLGCKNLKKVLTGNNIKQISTHAFNGTEIKEFYLKNYPYVYIWQDAFPDTKSADAVLYVPNVEGDYYADNWDKTAVSYFASWEYMQQCASPIISVTDNMLSISCDTEGAKCYYSLRTPDSTNDHPIESPIKLYAYYYIYATAKKDYYVDSSENYVLYWTGKSDNDGNSVNAIMADRRAILTSSRGGIINLSGLDDGETIEMYDLNGRKLATTKANGSYATLSAKTGEIIIIKVGEDTLKVTVR